jgi:DNA repair protein RecO (recombination protein O)
VALYRDAGIVLRTHRLGEADRIVTLLARDHGKVRAVAKGIRKTKSRFGGRLEPPAHVDVLLYAGRELDVVTQVETVNAFGGVRDDFDRLTRAIAMLEAVDQVTLEREPNPALYRMLVGALDALTSRDAPLVVPAFFFKLLALEGYRPQVESCTACGDSTDLVAWAIESGGLRCQAHRQGSAVSAEAVTLVQRILGGQLGAALAEPPSAATAEVDRLSVRVLEHHLERRLRSVSSLHRA